MINSKKIPVNSLFEQADNAGSFGTNSLVVTIDDYDLKFPLSGFYTSLLVFPVSLILLYSFSYASGHEVIFFFFSYSFNSKFLIE